jgi:phosphatidylserine decarboxylase
MGGTFLIALLRILPTHLMSHVAGFFMSLTVPRLLRPAVYRGYCALFGARAEDAELPLSEYRSVNAFFTRALKPGLRVVTGGVVVSPVDAAVGAAGKVEADTLWQAKGRTYSLAALLGDKDLAARMEGGTYQTLYLAPKDYHRIHFPLDGSLSRATYIPGKLWPVNQAAVLNVDSLFAVNERVVVQVDTPHGVMAVIPVGATMVGMTRLAFDPRLHTNARQRTVQQSVYSPPRPVRAGEPLGHFEFGSTVILVASPGCAVLDTLPVGSVVRMGQKIGDISRT